MTLNKSSNRKINKKENDIIKAWCNDFGSEEDLSKKDIGSYEINCTTDDPIFGNLVQFKGHKMKSTKASVDGYSEIEIALQKASEISSIDRPRMIFNISKSIKQKLPEEALIQFLAKSLDMDHITETQMNEILNILS